MSDSSAHTVLLTGGAGFIGSHTAVEFLRAGWDVVLLDDLSNAREDVPDRITRITTRRPRFYKGDAADRATVERVFSENKIDTVVHFAGLKAVGESVKIPLRYYRVNLDTILTVLEVMRAHDCRRVIFSSSATVYGETNTPPFTEDMPTGGCTNPYGRTKYMIEQILADAAAADPTLSVVLLRYFNPIGAHESGLLGERPSGTPNNLMPYVTQVAAGIRDHLSVFGDDYPTPDGTGVRDYIHVVDLAKGHLAAADYASEHTGCEAINLGSGRGHSVLELVHTFEEVNGVPIPYEVTPRRPGDIATSYADAGKAARLLHWRTERTLADMCRDAWNWERKSRE